MIRFASILAACILLSTVGCGDGVVCFGGDCSNDDDDKDTVTVSGDLESILPPNSTRDSSIFVYTGLDRTDLADGPPFSVYSDAKATLLDLDESFELNRLESGRLTVIFSRDAEPEPNGTIDPGDECSVLLDGGDLSDIRGNQHVTLDGVDIEYATSSCSGTPPAAGCGCTRADDIRVRTERPNDSDQE